MTQTPNGYGYQAALSNESVLNKTEKTVQYLTWKNGLLSKLFPLGKKFEHVEAGLYQYPVVSSYKGGVGARHPDGVFPVAQQVTPNWAQFNTTQTYGTIQMQQKYERVSRATSIMGTFTKQVERLIQNKTRLENMALLGDGSGVRAQANGAGTGSTVTVEYWDGSDAPGVTYFLEVGDPIAIIDAAGGLGTVKATSTISAVDRANGLITFADAIGAQIADGDYLVEGDINGDSYNRGAETGPINGIHVIGNQVGGTLSLGSVAGTYNGIALGTVPDWQAQIVGADTAMKAWDQLDLVIALTKHEQELDDDVAVSVLVVNPTWFVEQYKFQVDGTVFDTFSMSNGFELKAPVLNFMGKQIPIKQTKFMHPFHIAGIASDSWGIAMQMPWQFEKEGGGIRQRVPSRDAFYATMFEYKALECCLPNRNLFIKGVSVTDEASRF